MFPPRPPFYDSSVSVTRVTASVTRATPSRSGEWILAGIMNVFPDCQVLLSPNRLLRAPIESRAPAVSTHRSQAQSPIIPAGSCSASSPSDHRPTATYRTWTVPFIITPPSWFFISSLCPRTTPSHDGVSCPLRHTDRHVLSEAVRITQSHDFPRIARINRTVTPTLRIREEDRRQPQSR